MAIIHFLNVLEGDCNIIQHDTGHVTVIDVSNADNEIDTAEEAAKKASQARADMQARTQVPIGKTDYHQKQNPDNPIQYLNDRLQINSIFRFIITHPDMDHLDGLKDLFDSVNINCFWDTDNEKVIANFKGGGYNKEDWEFYLDLREGRFRSDVRRTFYAGNSWNYFDQDRLQILAPTSELVNEANLTDDYNDCSYVLLYTQPKAKGGFWKILFAGDSHDNTWEHILKNYKADVSDVDILFAPHHGRDSDRSYEFLDTLKPRITLFGNASSKHLAYDCYPEIRITNNQAGYIILDIKDEHLGVYVKNYEFARDFRSNPKRNYGEPKYNNTLDAWSLIFLL